VSDGGGLVESRSQADGQALLELAKQAAEQAGAMLLERFAQGRAEGVTSKSTPTDLVSDADLASERAIKALLAAGRPDDGFLGEEGDDLAGCSGLRWVVDPLDGTVNFLFGIPQWCVSVAVEDAVGTLAGVIFDPCRDELFEALRGRVARSSLAGADPRPLSGSARAEGLAGAMLATGFAYDADIRATQAHVLAPLVPQVRDIRRMGSAALDLAWTAAGRFDVFYERGVKRWDVAAGALICKQAGLLVVELQQDERLPAGVLAGAPALVEELLERAQSRV
jgi:myo-inositol-1(or 4)-monophosphatase